VKVTISLRDELFNELVRASREASADLTFSPQQFAAECVESILASRRLPRMAQSRFGPYRRRDASETGTGTAESDSDWEFPEPYPLHLNLVGQE
jgi:hypothetical protein